VPVPEFILEALIGRFGFPTLPKGALTHIMYPVVVDAKAFRDATGFKHAHDEIDTIASFRHAFPRPV
jgi:UDP-glucose 4-epimerase